MISNQVLQSTIDSLKSITRVDIAIADIDGKVLASTFTDNQYTESMVSSFAESQADSQAVGGYQFLISIILIEGPLMGCCTSYIVQGLDELEALAFGRHVQGRQ